MRIVLFFIISFILIGCGPDAAVEKAKSIGMKNPKCVRASGGEDGTTSSYCTDGRRLVICAASDCLVVNLDSEMPE